MSTANYLYDEAENLLCYDGPLIYEARCLERRLIDGKPEYLVHYKGWNESWEEWVDHTRLMKLNNKNIQKMISIKKEYSKVNKRKRTHSKVRSKTSKTTPTTNNNKFPISNIPTVSLQKPNVLQHSKPTTSNRQSQSSTHFTNSKSISTEVINAAEQNRASLENKVKVFDKKIMTDLTKSTITNKANLIKDLNVTQLNITNTNTEQTEADNLRVVKFNEANDFIERVNATRLHEANDVVEEVNITQLHEANDLIEEVNVTQLHEANDLVEEVNVTQLHEANDLIEEVNITQLHETVKSKEPETIDIITRQFIEANKAKILEDLLTTNHMEITGPTEVINDKITKLDKKIKIFNIKNHYQNAQLVQRTLPCVELPEINMPRELQRRLAYDYIMTTHVNKVLKFPNKYTIDKIISAFIKANSQLGHKYKERALNTGLILVQYFNNLQHKLLMYDEENVYNMKKKARIHLEKKVSCRSLTTIHYLPILYPKKAWHHIYGPTNLLRLIYKLPELLATSLYTDTQLRFIIENIEEFLKFVANNYDTYFALDDYVPRE